jgi:hypothetical protein
MSKFIAPRQLDTLRRSGSSLLRLVDLAQHMAIWHMSTRWTGWAQGYSMDMQCYWDDGHAMLLGGESSPTTHIYLLHRHRHCHHAMPCHRHRPPLKWTLCSWVDDMALPKSCQLGIMNGTAWIGYHTILLTKHNHHRQLQQPRFLLERVAIWKSPWIHLVWSSTLASHPPVPVLL